MQRALSESGRIDAPIAAVSIEPMPASKGLIGDLATVHIEYEQRDALDVSGPERLALKLPAANDDSRRIGSMLNAYGREAAFYEHVASDSSHFAPCFLNEADAEQDRWALAIEFIDGDAFDFVGGATHDQATAAVDALAALHADWWNGAAEFEWMPGFDRGGVGGLAPLWRDSLPVFTERYREVLPGETASWVLAFAPQLADWSAGAADDPLTLVHADYRLDNLLFRGRDVTIIDWQTAMRAPAAMDLSCFIATSLTVDDRRAHEDALIDRYLAALARGDVEVDHGWFRRSYDENLLWWMGQFGNNLAYLDPDDAEVARALTAMIERVYSAGHDHDVGRLL